MGLYLREMYHLGRGGGHALPGKFSVPAIRCELRQSSIEYHHPKSCQNAKLHTAFWYCSQDSELAPGVYQNRHLII